MFGSAGALRRMIASAQSFTPQGVSEYDLEIATFILTELELMFQRREQTDRLNGD